MTEKQKTSSASKRRAARSKTSAALLRSARVASANAVYFTSLTVENIRCFGPPQRLDLADEKGHPAQWTVLLGDNGVGKTTLLQCLAELEPTDLMRGRHDKPWIVARAILPNLFTPSEYVRFRADGNARITAELSWGRKIGQNRGKIHTAKLSYQTSARPSSGMSSMSTSNEILDLDCYAYGAARSMGTGTLAESDVESRTNSLFDENVGLRNAEEWLLRTDYRAEF